MKKQLEELRDPNRGIMKCLYCGGVKWSLIKKSENPKSEKWRCEKGCMNLFAVWDNTKEPSEFIGYSPF